MQEQVYAEFTERVAATVGKLRQGPALGHGPVDCGAMCLPGLAERVQELVDDAVALGARVSTQPLLSAVMCQSASKLGQDVQALQSGAKFGTFLACDPAA